jgi:hypothetical protein
VTGKSDATNFKPNLFFMRNVYISIIITCLIEAILMQQTALKLPFRVFMGSYFIILGAILWLMAITDKPNDTK